MRIVRRTIRVDFKFHDTEPAAKKYGPFDVMGRPLHGSVRSVEEEGKETLWLANVMGPLITVKGTPFKDGIEYWLDAPELEERMLKRAGHHPAWFDVKDGWIANGGLPE